MYNDRFCVVSIFLGNTPISKSSLCPVWPDRISCLFLVRLSYFHGCDSLLVRFASHSYFAHCSPIIRFKDVVKVKDKCMLLQTGHKAPEYLRYLRIHDGNIKRPSIDFGSII